MKPLSTRAGCSGCRGERAEDPGSCRDRLGALRKFGLLSRRVGYALKRGSVTYWLRKCRHGVSRYHKSSVELQNHRCVHIEIWRFKLDSVDPGNALRARTL